MRILTVRQPWAHAILYLGKDVENRVWTTPYRGPVALHAGTKPDPAGVEWLRENDIWHGDVRDLPKGAIVGAFDLVDIARDVSSRWAQPDRFHFSVARPRPLPEPLPWIGALKLRALPAEVAAVLTLLTEEEA